MSATEPCARCARTETQLARAHAQLREALKLIELQRADLERLRAERIKSAAPAAHHPERVPEQDLAAAFERVVQSLAEQPAANDGTRPLPATPAQPSPARPASNEPRRKSRPHGRRRLDRSALPVQRVVLDPDEVIAAGGVGFRLIGEAVSERIAFAPASYFRLQLVRRTWARIEQDGAPESLAVITAALPVSVWPHTMADPSAIAHHIVSKYQDVLPLHRQEQISARQGFVIARSTQCDWLHGAYRACYRVVDAMFAEAKARAFCIATDATGAPVRGEGGCVKWHVFTFRADDEHVLFRHSPAHDGATVRAMLRGYRGYLQADGASIHDVLFRECGMVEVGCWAHCRRYFYRALGADPARAHEALALIGKLFEIDRQTRALSADERTRERAARAGPVLAMLDAWVERHREGAEPRGPLRAAIVYYDNQRQALRRFLEDGRLALSNNHSERSLRNLALGRHNWLWFANEAGLKWYCTFRSLIASCALHGLNPQTYLEQLLRLAPHWPVTRMIELSPKYWAQTVAQLDPAWRAALVRPWDLRAATIARTEPRRRAATSSHAA